MQSVSTLFQTLWEAENHIVETKLVINGVTYTDDIILVDTSNPLFADGIPQAGCVVCGSLYAQIVTPAVTIPRMASVKPYIRLTDGTQTSEWIQKGEFFTDKQYADDDGVLTINAYDALIKTTNVMYTTTGAQENFPKSDIAMVREIAQMIGVSVDSRTTSIMNKNYQVEYVGFGDGGYTMREILGYIAAMYAGNFCISDTGKLRLISLAYGLPT